MVSIVPISLALLTSPLVLQERPPAPPRAVLKSDPSSYLWVAAEELLDEEGRLDLTWLPAGSVAARHIETVVKLDRGRRPDRGSRRVAAPWGLRLPYPEERHCEIKTASTSHAVAYEPESLPELVAKAKAVVYGRVAGGKQGFLNGRPGSMLEIDVEEVLRTAGDDLLEGRVFLAYPYGVFSIHGVWFCGTRKRFDYRAEVGDRVLLFPIVSPRSNYPSVVEVWPSGVVAGRDGALVTPVAGTERKGSFAAVLEEARSLLEVTP